MKRWIAGCMALLLIVSLVGCQRSQQEKVTVYLLTGVVKEYNGKVTEVDIRYDENGNLTEYYRGPKGFEKTLLAQCSYDRDSNMLSYWNLNKGIDETYDSQGNLLSEVKDGRRSENTYDEESRLLTVTRYDEAGNVVVSACRTYDAQGNLLREYVERGEEIIEEVRTYDEEGNLLTLTTNRDGQVETEIHTYDAQGNHLSENHSLNGEPHPKEPSHTWAYDDRGNLVEYRRYLAGVPGQYALFTYDDQNRLLSCATYQTDGSICQEYYTWDEADRQIRYEKVTTTADGKEKTFAREMEYDMWGNRVAEREFYENGLVIVVTWEYDQDRHLLHHYRKGHYDQRWVYDEKGNLIRETHDLYGKTHEITYTYDENGNMLTMVKTYDDGRVVETVWTYDENGNQLTMRRTGWEDAEASYVYDAQGNLIQSTSITSAGTSTTTYTYTAIEVTAEQAAQILEQQDMVFAYWNGGVMELF